MTLVLNANQFVSMWKVFVKVPSCFLNSYSPSHKAFNVLSYLLIRPLLGTLFFIGWTVHRNISKHPTESSEENFKICWYDWVNYLSTTINTNNYFYGKTAIGKLNNLMLKLKNHTLTFSVLLMRLPLTIEPDHMLRCLSKSLALEFQTILDWVWKRKDDSDSWKIK